KESWSGFIEWATGAFGDLLRVLESLGLVPKGLADALGKAGTAGTTGANFGEREKKEKQAAGKDRHELSPKASGMPESFLATYQRLQAAALKDPGQKDAAEQQLEAQEDTNEWLESIYEALSQPRGPSWLAP